MPTDFKPSPAEPASSHIVTVTMLNRWVRETLETAFPTLWVEGEISNFTRAPSGHLYFTLKDAGAQVRCAMWRQRAQGLGFAPAHGMRVEARATVTLFEARGDYQLNIEGLRPAGQGRLAEAFLRLKERLGAEGLFDPARKRPMPPFPRGIGIISSPQAAALRDVLAALGRRAPHLPIVIYPAPVQGEGAAVALLAALGRANARWPEDGVDLLLLVRGGGSLEDLVAFNDEGLARGIAASRLPVIAGIGHETDFTIADFVADQRAATPTAAAELASAGYVSAGHTLAQQLIHLRRAMARRLAAQAQRLDRATLRLVPPGQRLGLARLRVERLAERLSAALRRPQERQATHLTHLAMRLARAAPDLGSRQDRLLSLSRRLDQAVRVADGRRRDRLTALAQHLDHLNPQAILDRGYAIVRHAEGGIVRHAIEAPPGAHLEITLAQGGLDATVTRQRD
ncbi:MAG: exodeoxyribonuclease VII large subunit [Zoogloeaceae bacterium]|nr:exodeoxyribonuclease VII large subunit [Zoogloeaceae bacterium]